MTVIWQQTGSQSNERQHYSWAMPQAILTYVRSASFEVTSQSWRSMLIKHGPVKQWELLFLLHRALGEVRLGKQGCHVTPMRSYVLSAVLKGTIAMLGGWWYKTQSILLLSNIFSWCLIRLFIVGGECNISDIITQLN